jgi:hypothetical protein
MATNTTAATAIDMATLPYAITMDPEGDSELWWRYTATTGQLMVSVFGFSPANDADDPDMPPYVTVYSDPDSLIIWQQFNTVGHRPIAVPVDPGVTYWIRFTGVPDSTFTVTADPQPDEDVPAGALIVPDDTEGFPGVILDPSTGAVLRVIDTPMSESGAVLNDGTFMIYDGATDVGTDFLIYNADYSLRVRIPAPLPAVNALFPLITSDHEQFFYIAQTAVGTSDPQPLLKIDANGNTVDSWMVPNDLSSGAVSRDNAILYHSGGALAEGVRRYDLVADAALSTWAVGVAGMNRPHENIRVLSDDTVLVGYRRISGGTDMVRHYQSDGTLLHTYTVTTYGAVASDLDRFISTYDDRSDAFWLWLQPGDPVTDDVLARFVLVQVSDGAALTTWTLPHFTGGIGSRDNGADSTRFGPSFSCPVLTSQANEVEVVDPPDPEQPLPCPGCGTGPGGTPPSIGYGPPSDTAPPVNTPRIVPEGGEAPSYTPCSTGGDPASASDPSDPQSLTDAVSPVVWVQITLPDATVLRYNGQGLNFTSGNGAVSSPRVTRWAPVTHALADPYGSIQAMRTTVRLADTDRVLRSILESQHVDGAEVVIYAETRANAALGVAPFVLARGILTNWKAVQ